MYKVRREHISVLELLLCVTPSIFCFWLFLKSNSFKLIYFLGVLFLSVLLVIVFSRAIAFLNRRYFGRVLGHGNDEMLLLNSCEVNWKSVKQWGIKTQYPFSRYILARLVDDYTKTIYVKTSKLIIFKNAPRTLEKLFIQHTNTYDKDFKFEETPKTIVINLY